VSVPIIAGGLIENHEELASAFEAGASAVSTGCTDLWK
jgi:glycerol uptake operon antiterminator